MIAGVADTHAALGYLLKNPRLSKTVRFLPSAWPKLSILSKRIACRSLPITI